MSIQSWAARLPGDGQPDQPGPPGQLVSPGDRYTVTLLFRERHAELVRLALLLVGDRPTAEDVVQDVFTRLCARDCLPGADGALSYVRAAVLNGCRSVLRRRQVAHRVGLRRDPAAEPVLTQGSAEQEAIVAEQRREVLIALAALPSRRREVLVLRYWLGLTESEIAAVLGITRGTVRSTAARALAALARKLGEES
jgi:RNA polymerase sigma factor (sigma-70 family)